MKILNSIEILIFFARKNFRYIVNKKIHKKQSKVLHLTRFYSIIYMKIVFIQIINNTLKGGEYHH